MILRFVLPVLALLGWGTSSFATWQTFDTGDGLADDLVNAILEDTNGALWFGAERGGITRFDGVHWQIFSDDDGLFDENVTSALEDRNGMLWFGTYGGCVMRYDGRHWQTVAVDAHDDETYVTAIVEDRLGRFWFAVLNEDGDYGRVLRLDGSVWTSFTTRDGLAHDRVHAILEDRSGRIWFATEGGVSRFDNEQWISFTMSDGLTSNFVTVLSEDESGRMWFGTDGGGVSLFDGDVWRTYTSADGLASDHVTAVLADSRGDLWVGTEDGVTTLRAGLSARTYTRADGLGSDYVNTIHEDRAGNLWFATYGGATRWDRAAWKTYTSDSGLPDNIVNAICEDRSGRIWFGTSNGGAGMFDGSTWRTYTTRDGLASDGVTAILEDRGGAFWFGTYNRGVSRFDGTAWTSDLDFTSVRAIAEDHLGRVWVGMERDGVARFDGTSWTRLTTADGLVDNNVTAIHEDRQGRVWIGTCAGLSRLDGSQWTTYTTADGLGGDCITAIEVDRDGKIWFGTCGAGVTRHDGETWRTYTSANGLASDCVSAICEDSRGNLWFGTNGSGVTCLGVADGIWRTYTAADGLADGGISVIAATRAGDLWFGFIPDAGATVFEPDLVSPLTVFLHRPGAIVGTREVSVSFLAAFGDVGVEFSCALDGEAWSPWSEQNVAVRSGAPDGEHIFMVRAHDQHGNVEISPAACRFEVDATPPSAVVASPAFGQVVRDSVRVFGSVADGRFSEYRVDVRVPGAPSWEMPDAAPLARSTTPVTSGPLAVWPTAFFADGRYELRVAVADSLGLVGSTIIEAMVDNTPPWADVTSPALVSAAGGGDVYTTTGLVHLYFPPHAFAQDAVVTIAVLADSTAPDSLGQGRRVADAYEISWGTAELRKPGTMEICYPSQIEESCGPVTIYSAGADSVWRRLGGTDSRSEMKIVAPLAAPGRYALSEESVALGGPVALSGLATIPRVFSPLGSFANDKVGVSFTLGRSGSVTVRVYNRAGRLVRALASDPQMKAGANVVFWDGRGEDGEVVEDGLYLVSVEALGHKRTKTLSVVR
jgi:ligand-binding sensor domain-containing protein